MADIDIGDAQRFKLFGTTIAVQVKEEMVKGDDQGTAQQRTGRIIPCPRCKSMETKFCYFNNYNINQPRHFCRSCQRYWTAGGTLRNIPVGAGRRKSKPSTRRPIRLSDNFIFDAPTVDEFLHGGWWNSGA